MVKQNLANRLAAGGYWAIQIAQMSVEVAQYLRERGDPLPPGMDTDAMVFEVSGVGAFEHVVNTHLDGARMHVGIRPTGGPQCFDKQGQPISLQTWQALVREESYKRVGLWRNDSEHVLVSTVWMGVDPNACQPPHIFETIVVRANSDGEPKIVNHFGSTTLDEAADTHNHVVALVNAGKL